MTCVLLLVPAYLGIGALVGAGLALCACWGWAIRPTWGEICGVALVALVCWPMLLWAAFHEERGE